MKEKSNYTNIISLSFDLYFTGLGTHIFYPHFVGLPTHFVMYSTIQIVCLSKIMSIKNHPNKKLYDRWIKK